MRKIFSFFIMFVLLINTQFAFASTTTDDYREKYLLNNRNFFDNQAPCDLVEKESLKSKPWYLSLIIPGLGQIFMGDIFCGITYLISFPVFMLITAAFVSLEISHYSISNKIDSVGQGGIPSYFMWISILFTSSVYIINVIHSYYIYTGQNNNRVTENGSFIKNLNVSNKGFSYTLVSF